MNETKKLMPESQYVLDNTMSYEKLTRSLNSDTFVVGKAVYWDSKKQHFLVNLGNSIFGTMPIEEASIYSTRNLDGKLTAEAYSLIGRIICVKIIDLQTDKIVVSRKSNMLTAFDIISNSKDQTVDCCVKSLAGTMIFLDVGHGISGMLHVMDLCSSRIEHVCDLGIKEKDILKAKIKTINPHNFHIGLGYKELFENISGNFNPDDLIEVITLYPIHPDGIADGYFVYVNPNTSAILNPIEGTPIPYGSRVVARVRSSSPSKLKLGFISFV